MESSVYLGQWTNWSRGPILGATLTTTKSYGNLLIAFVAIFIAFVASRFWRILCLVLHRCYSTSEARDAIHHQRQVVLRNSLNPESGLLNTIRLVWAWRKTPVNRLVRLLPIGLLAVICLVAFTIASGFSSSISTAAGDEVLVRSTHCGPIRFTQPSTSVVAIGSQFNAEKLNDAANYAQRCYNSNSTACNTFVVERLPTATMNTTSSCPFQNRICRDPESTLRLDTGYIDSNDGLGLSAPTDQRFAWRYVLHCAPLRTKGYTSRVADTDKGWIRFHYGNVSVGALGNQTKRDSLYEVEDSDFQYQPRKGNSLAGSNFRLSYDNSRTFQGKPADGFFTPIPELARPDGDTTMIFLSGNGVPFGQLMDDGWYRATDFLTTISHSLASGAEKVYRPSVAASPMGCVEQWQWCNSAYPRDTGCGPLAGQSDALYGAATPFNLTGEDLYPDRPLSSEALGTRLIWPALLTLGYPTALPSLLGHLGSKSLASQSRLYSGVQWALPNNQWQLDVIQWWNTILASVQASCTLNHSLILSRSYNPLKRATRLFYDPEFREYISPPLNEDEQKLCNSQKIRSSTHSSFSLFGLYIIFIFGAIIICVSFALEPLLACLYKRRKYKPYTHFEWISNNSLQLHRLAQEELGLTKWSRCTEEVPTTDCDAYLASLDITDPRHPVLHSPENQTIVDKPEQEVPQNDVELAMSSIGRSQSTDGILSGGASINTQDGARHGRQQDAYLDLDHAYADEAFIINDQDSEVPVREPFQHQPTHG
ncbi:hypothetical protein NPX13_g7103 [Xylaria arbuscula]|uniref:Uncharacterized protein n=1 Tax=Xylaria arbuscula TaxID=114810 RepID=A0A9W8NBB0_9PEZI|nr:hypothetical protein NPX13_g7103 [Xylaria arbuscula]